MDVIFSDPHFGHNNIIKHCGRTQYMTKDELEEFNAAKGDPALLKKLRISNGSIQRMNAAIIEELNTMAGPNDTIYCLGDWAWLKGGKRDSRKVAQRYRDRIQARNIHLIKGNHDRVCIAPVFTSMSSLQKTNIENATVWLCHYALRTWAGIGRGHLHMYGHSHGNLLEDPNLRSMDVGVDAWGPIYARRAIKYLQEKKYVPVDHH